MNIAKIHHEANSLIAETYGTTNISEFGSVIVTGEEKSYRVYFQKKETGWLLFVQTQYNSCYLSLAV